VNFKPTDIKVSPSYVKDEARVQMVLGSVTTTMEPVVAAYLACELLKAANYFDDRLPVLRDQHFYFAEPDHDFNTCSCEGCARIRSQVAQRGDRVQFFH
jgi:hypothetical protein